MRENAYTVVIEMFHVYIIGSVVKVDVFLAVRPALYHEVARLRVKREQRAVQVTRCLQHSTKPPLHYTRVIDVSAEQLEIVLVKKLACTMFNPQNNC